MKVGNNGKELAKGKQERKNRKGKVKIKESRKET